MVVFKGVRLVKYANTKYFCIVVSGRYSLGPMQNSQVPTLPSGALLLLLDDLTRKHNKIAKKNPTVTIVATMQKLHPGNIAHTRFTLFSL